MSVVSDGSRVGCGAAGGGRGDTVGEKWSRSAMQDVGRLCIFPTAQQRGRRTLLYWGRILSYQSL